MGRQIAPWGFSHECSIPPFHGVGVESQERTQALHEGCVYAGLLSFADILAAQRPSQMLQSRALQDIQTVLQKRGVHLQATGTDT